MISEKPILFTRLTIAAICLAGVVLSAAPSAALAVTLTDISVYHTSPSTGNPTIVPQYGVFELTLARPVDYGLPNNFFDVAITATFTGRATGTQVSVKGFYYDTLPNGQALWKLRFAPRKTDTWIYQYTYTHTPSGDHGSGTGAFQCIPGTAPGFLKRNSGNNFRFQFENGQPFAPLGQNDCLGIRDTMSLEGGDRNGAFRGPSSRTDEYFRAYEAAGFNMFRFSQSNCSFDLTNGTFTS